MRVYLIGNKKYPSVTTILSVINKPGLMYYYGKHGTQKANVLSKIARLMGIRLHKYIEKDCTGKSQSFFNLLMDKGKLDTKKKSGRRLMEMINQYLWFKSKYDFKFKKSEKAIYSEKYGYAGTVDCVGDIKYKGEVITVIGDWKSSGKVYDEALLQVVAYLKAHEERYPKYKIDGIMCVSFNKELKDRDPEIKIIINRKKIEEIFKIFLCALEIYNWQERRK